jgi:uncharacterized protein
MLDHRLAHLVSKALNGACTAMGHTPLPTDLVDLAPLDAFLLSDRAPDNCMGLSDLDGYLTGIAVGPVLIPSSEWMPIIWGGDEPTFSDLTEAQSVLGTIMARYNQIISNLRDDPTAFAPIFWQGPDGKVIVTDWAAGFLDAARLRPKSWDPLIRDPKARVLITLLLILGAEDDDHPPLDRLPLPADTVEELMATGAEIIPDCVVGIHAYWQAQGAKSPPMRTRNRWGAEARRRRR